MTEQSDDQARLAESEFNAAEAVLRKCVPGKPGFGAEARYGAAYQRLVHLGLRPQLRLRYRG